MGATEFRGGFSPEKYFIFGNVLRSPPSLRPVCSELAAYWPFTYRWLLPKPDSLEGSDASTRPENFSKNGPLYRVLLFFGPVLTGVLTSQLVHRCLPWRQEEIWPSMQ